MASLSMVAEPAPEDTTVSNKPSSSTTTASNVADARYTFNEESLQDLRKNSPWTKEPKYFQKVAISPSAISKMMMHCHSGVEKGIKKGGNPIEVMGMLLGRPDPDTPRTLIVTDAFPLPIEGFETRVIADDANVINHMISLGECLEKTRKEKFMGWYHSHPFDLAEHSHCFLSQTDLSTQLQWQRAEDPHGNPFVAIVVDPLRSLNKSHPELKAFRAYPPEYQSPVADECPNGSVIRSEQARLEQWGSCWSRYYELQIEYFMSSSARRVMEKLTKDYIWIRTLGTTPLSDVEQQKRFINNVSSSSNKIKRLDVSSTSLSKSLGASIGSVFTMGGGGASSAGTKGTSIGKKTGSGSSDGTSGDGKEVDELAKACQEVVDLATEQLHGATIHNAKQQLFGKTSTRTS